MPCLGAWQGCIGALFAPMRNSKYDLQPAGIQLRARLRTFQRQGDARCLGVYCAQSIITASATIVLCGATHTKRQCCTVASRMRWTGTPKKFAEARTYPALISRYVACRTDGGMRECSNELTDVRSSILAEGRRHDGDLYVYRPRYYRNHPSPHYSPALGLPDANELASYPRSKTQSRRVASGQGMGTPKRLASYGREETDDG